VLFRSLNFGRLKLGAICVGWARNAIGEAARYAATRKQFGQPIFTFGAIKHKLGQMCVRAYGVESLIYRTVGLIDARIAAAPHDLLSQSVTLTTFEEYAVEASIAKVAGSEMLEFVLDENVQIHGGNGYVRDYPAERHYRDARVNRIFEGTNEINRLLVPGMLARRASKGALPLIAAARALQDELLAPPQIASKDNSPLAPLAEARRSVDGFKKVALMSLGLAMETHREALAEQQEVLMHLADILIDTYAADSTVLRATAVGEGPGAALHADAARVFVSDAGMRIDASARQALAALAEGDALRTALAALGRLSQTTPVNAVPLRRGIAEQAVASVGYVF
jgi:alkylation response protein AidB-like acyl-CoA dehydrogenase